MTSAEVDAPLGIDLPQNWSAHWDDEFRKPASRGCGLGRNALQSYNTPI
jgi:hypothetical protein